MFVDDINRYIVITQVVLLFGSDFDWRKDLFNENLSKLLEMKIKITVDCLLMFQSSEHGLCFSPARLHVSLFAGLARSGQLYTSRSGNFILGQGKLTF